MLLVRFGKRNRTTGTRFNGHPPLGVNATVQLLTHARTPTPFQWAPTLGGECYEIEQTGSVVSIVSFNGHPPLGVNATRYALSCCWQE